MKLSQGVILKIIILPTVISFCACNEEAVQKSAMHLVNFRKLMEETSAENTSDNERRSTNKNFVSFLVQNAKKLFSPPVILEPESDTDEITEALPPTPVDMLTTKEINYDESIDNILSDIDDLSNNNSETILLQDISDIHINNETDEPLSMTDVSYNLMSTQTTLTNITDGTEIQTLVEFTTTDEVLILEKTAVEEIDAQPRQPVAISVSKTASDKVVSSSTKRSCIACDNVASADCNDPKNKLISSRVCDREEDLCFSMHTPFGIVNRGCFSVNHNLSTYVCSCNLCNYISISEMPYVFSEKRDWVENVKELSRNKRLRKSILKDMSCLRCEVNISTLRSADILENSNCLEGNLNTLPLQECAGNEICGVRAIRSEGYVWRGCLSRPLYNYWWALCDTDLCNHDSLVSISDEF